MVNNKKTINYNDIKRIDFKTYQFKIIKLLEGPFNDLQKYNDEINVEKEKLPEDSQKSVEYFEELNKTFEKKFFFEYYLGSYWDKSKNTFLKINDLAKKFYFKSLFHFLVWLDIETERQLEINENFNYNITNICNYLNQLISTFLSEINNKKNYGGEGYEYNFNSIKDNFNEIKIITEIII